MEGSVLITVDEVKKEKVEINKIGLVVSPKWLFLGCSPDCVVLENGVPIGCIEIKWPYSKSLIVIFIQESSLICR